MAEICVDASFSLKLVLREPEQKRVRAQWARWMRNRHSFVAPELWLFETHNAIYRNVFSGRLTMQEGPVAWRLMLNRGVRLLRPDGLFQRAWTLAESLARPTSYDAMYLALAQIRGCEFWT